MVVSIADAAWTAGIIDGEGSIGAAVEKYNYNKGKGRIFIRNILSVANTDRRLIDRLHRLWGGTICTYRDKRPPRRPAWKWELSGKRAANVLRFVSPYLVSKRTQAFFAMMIADSAMEANRLGAGRVLSPAVMRMRHTARYLISRLNHGRV